MSSGSREEEKWLVLCLCGQPWQANLGSLVYLYLAGRSQTKWNRMENQRSLLELPEPLLIFRFGEGKGRGRQKCPEEETKAVRGPLGKCILNI